MGKPTVGILGASGETGRSILNGLLGDGGFDIIVFARPSSLTKPANVALKDIGVDLRPLDLATDDQPKIVAALKGVDILISAIGPGAQLDQIPLATAAKTAGVKRFVPCAFIPVIPAGGVHDLRDQKEMVYNHARVIGLPYTIIDCGWWYQIAFPSLPSGKIDYAVLTPMAPLAGDGDMPSGLTDLRDVGRHVSKVIQDERTLNKMVFVYNEMWSQNQIWDKLEALSGEKIPRTYVTGESLQEKIESDKEKVAGDPTNYLLMMDIVGNQYMLSWGVRGHNTPEYAKFLGYLTSKELYPDFQPVKFEDYLLELLRGKAETVYPAMDPQLRSSLQSRYQK